MNNAHEDHIQTRARALFLRASDEIDSETERHLREARRRALEPGRTINPARFLLPAGALAAMLVGVIGLRQIVRTPTPAPQASATLPADFDPSLVDDLDFSSWLAQHPELLAQQSQRSAR